MHFNLNYAALWESDTRQSGLSVKLCGNSVNKHLGFGKWFFHLFSTCDGLQHVRNNYSGISHMEQL